MIKRDLAPELMESSTEYPVVTLFGPRQSGKTTLVQATFPDKPYFSLEDPDIRSAIQLDPRGVLEPLIDGAILDEIQRVPKLLSYIQGIVDKRKKAGQFILTGSHQPDLHHAVTQSLAGRSAILTLLPLSIAEVTKDSKENNIFPRIVKGGYPRIYKDNLKIERFYNSYLQTYVERDVRALLNLKDLDRFQQFLVLLAGRIGQLVNYNSISNDIGVSAPTIKNWISVLKASYIIFELPPFHQNIRKRLVKSSKIYFTDTGFASFLLSIHTSEQISRDPLRGALYENIIILEIMKNSLNSGKKTNLFFFRDATGHEVDLLIHQGRELLPVEIKSSATFSKDFLKGISYFRNLSVDCSQKGIVFYNGTQQLNVDGNNICNILLHKFQT